MAKPPDIGKLSFEEALAELETIVRALESGEAKLDQAIEAYARGVLLRRHCEAKLAEAQARIERIELSPDGTIAVRDFDPKAGENSNADNKRTAPPA